jgi:hypothetical protein
MQFIPALKDSTRYTVEWETLRDVTLRLCKGDGSDFSRPSNRRYALETIKGDRSYDQWRGYTVNQLNEWLTSGYQNPAIHNLDDFAPPIREKRQYIVTEDGEEMLIDLVLSGADEYYGDFTKQDVIPGLAVDAEVGMVVSNDSRVLIDYFKWLNRTLYALDSVGIDCEVTLKYECRSLFRQSGRPTTTVVAVKRENEKTDFLSWSPMISPASFRSLIFVANLINAEARDWDVERGQGTRGGGQWSVDYVPETSTLRIDCEWSSRVFPEEKMQAMFDKCLLQVKGKSVE